MGQKLKPPVALVVEDDESVRELVVALLGESELSIVEKTNGLDALDYLYRHAGEVVFVFADVRLPGPATGVDIARMARLRWPWIRTVVTSGEPLDEKLPPDVGFLAKPWRGLDVLVEAERARVGQ